jgi:hypothetical protein
MYMRKYLNACMHPYVHTYMLAYVHTHTYIYTYTYIHSHTHTHLQILVDIKVYLQETIVEKATIQFANEGLNSVIQRTAYRLLNLI